MARSSKIRLMVGAVVAVMSVGAVAMGAVYAQQPAGGQGQATTGRKDGMGRPLAALRHGLAQLNLSDDQKAQVKTIVQGHKTQLQGFGQQLRDARRALGDAIANDADEATIRAKAGDLAKVQADFAVFGAQVRKQIFGILTPDQQAKAKTLRMQALVRMDRFMAGRRKGLGL